MGKIKYYKFQGEGKTRIFVDNNVVAKELSVENARKICEMERVSEVVVLEKSNDADFFLRKFTVEGTEVRISVKETIGALLFADFLGLSKENRLHFHTAPHHFNAEILDKTEGRIKLMSADVSAVMKRGDDLYLESNPSGYVRFVKFVGYADVEQEGAAICTEERREGMSVNFVELRAEGAVNVRTYECGVEIDSSVTGSVVSAVAASFKYQPHKTSFTVNTPEGCFDVNFEKIKQGEYCNTELVGMIKMVFKGEFSV